MNISEIVGNDYWKGKRENSSLVRITEAVAICPHCSRHVSPPPSANCFPEPYFPNSPPALGFWNLPFLPTFLGSFWSQHFTSPNAEPPCSCSWCSQQILLSDGLHPISWTMKKKRTSPRNGPFTLTRERCNQMRNSPSRRSKHETASCTFTRLSSWVNLSEHGLQGMMLFLPL